MIPAFDQMSYNDGYGAELQCPNCNGNYLHHEKIEVFEREEDAKSGLQVTVAGKEVTTSTSLSGNPSLRRHGIAISFSCEFCDAVPVLTIAQHKGNTLVDMNFTIDKNKKNESI
ncbi:hypothetical protein [Vreelandella populi]|uniref:hypothetical protein n=1 Tax=Vreelandella populi TaxID=2498858 RepID=UPI000F8E830B|nr:hypothetical protein [Halomonas populi]RUR51430.1 hypothetical protein ELY40_16660 [Halomonas populi]